MKRDHIIDSIISLITILASWVSMLNMEEPSMQSKLCSMIINNCINDLHFPNIRVDSFAFLV